MIGMEMRRRAGESAQAPPPESWETRGRKEVCFPASLWEQVSTDTQKKRFPSLPWFSRRVAAKGEKQEARE